LQLVETPPWALQVWDKLTAELLPSERPDFCAQWPPVLIIVESASLPEKHRQNASAAPAPDGKGGLMLDEEQRYVPLILVSTFIFNTIIEEQPDRFALIIGHEIGHHVKGHIRKQIDHSRQENKPLSEEKGIVPLAFDRQQEFDCDDFAAQLLLRAGFSLRIA